LKCNSERKKFNVDHLVELGKVHGKVIDGKQKMELVGTG
jgi:hypothetical protein